MEKSTGRNWSNSIPASDCAGTLRTPYLSQTSLIPIFVATLESAKEGREEFYCAKFRATELEGVKYWVRNVRRKPTSFSLQTNTDRFYPDFLCDWKTGAVEYKNKTDWTNEDSKEKRRIGGKCLFMLPRGKAFEADKKNGRGIV